MRADIVRLDSKIDAFRSEAHGDIVRLGERLGATEQGQAAMSAKLEPTWCVNAESCDGVPLAEYDFVLADPPYSAGDAERYGTSMVNRNKVVATLAAGLPLGAVVVWLDQIRPMYAKVALQTEAVIGIVGSTNHRFLVLTVFRRV